MNIKITKELKNPLLGRKIVEFQISSKVTPSRKEVKTELAKELKTNESQILIDSVRQKMGTNLTIGRAKIYESEELLKRVDLDYKLMRGEKKKPADGSEASKEPTKAEKPAKSGKA